VLWDDDEESIIDLSSLDRLARMHVYCMNCLSGKGLGTHAVSKGVLEYWGYVDSVAFTTEAIDAFGEAFIDVVAIALRLVHIAVGEALTRLVELGVTGRTDALERIY
jgi:hypothetical protein